MHDAARIGPRRVLEDLRLALEPLHVVRGAHQDEVVRVDHPEHPQGVAVALLGVQRLAGLQRREVEGDGARGERVRPEQVGDQRENLLDLEFLEVGGRQQRGGPVAQQEVAGVHVHPVQRIDRAVPVVLGQIAAGDGAVDVRLLALGERELLHGLAVGLDRLFQLVPEPQRIRDVQRGVPHLGAVLVLLHVGLEALLSLVELPREEVAQRQVVVHHFHGGHDRRHLAVAQVDDQLLVIGNRADVVALRHLGLRPLHEFARRVLRAQEVGAGQEGQQEHEGPSGAGPEAGWPI